MTDFNFHLTNTIKFLNTTSNNFTVTSAADEPDIYEPVPLARLSWDCLTEKEARTQKNYKNQYSRKLHRLKTKSSKRTLKFAKWILKKEYSSQSSIGSFLNNTWTKLCSQVSLPGMDRVMNYGENLLLLLLNLRGCNSWTAAFAAITMYVKLHCKDQALATQILDSIKEDSFDSLKYWDESLLEDDDAYTSQSSSPKVSTWTRDSNPFEMIFSSWDTLKNSPIKSKIMGLISTALAVGMLSEARDLAPSVKGLTLFRISASKGQTTMMDLCGTIITTMKFFVERGYKCFEAGSLEPFLYEDDSAFDFQNDLSRIVSNFEYIKIGTYKDTNEKCPWADEKDFERDLLKVIDDCLNLRKSASQRDRVLLDRHYDVLGKIRTAFELLRTTGGLREAPFSFCIFGASGIGKSTLVNNLMTYSLQKIMWEKGIKDYEVDPNSICTLNEMDKYHSDYKSHIQGVLLDDFANAKADVTSVNPSVNVINFINNVARTAIMAEAELKGKIQLNPLVVAATTNVKDLDARTYSNEPVSILRRFQLHIEARVKPEYLRDAEAAFIDGKKLALDAADGNLCPDAWEFDVYEWFSGNGVRAASKPIMYRDPSETDPDAPKKQANSVGMETLLMIIDSYVKDHVKIQKSVVSSSKDIFKQKLCKHGTMPQYCRHCGDDEEETSYVSQSLFSDDREQPSVFTKLYDEYQCNSSVWRWENYLPQTVFQNFKVQCLSTYMNSRTLLKTYFSVSSLLYLFSAVSMPSYALTLFSTYCISALTAMSARKNYVVSKLAESRALLPRVFQNIRDVDLSRGKKMFVFFSAIIALYVIYINFIKSVPTKMEKQGNQFSVHMEEHNPWLATATVPVPLPMKECATAEQLGAVIEKNQVKVTLGRETANGLFIKSNILLVPSHLVPSDKNFTLTSVYSAGFVHGGNFTKSVNQEDVCKLPDCDLSLVYVSSGGDRKDITKYFPLTKSRAQTTTTSFYNDGDVIQSKKHRIYKYNHIDTGRASFLGALVRYDDTTFAGQCGTTHISQTSAACILGFHAAGIANTPEGALTTTTHGAIVAGIKKLEDRSHILLPLGSGAMVTQSYGIDFTPEDKIQRASPMNFQTTAQVDVYGKLPGVQPKTKSGVVTSPISDVVEQVTGVANKHGPPANCRKKEDGGIPSWEPYQKYIAGVGNAYQEFPSDVMQWAIEDYFAGFDELFESDFGKDLLSRVKVLDDVEATSGIDSMKFVDAMKPATSMGYPVNKSKVDYMELFPLEHESVSYPRIMDDETLRLAQRARTLWLQDQRSYDVFRTCTKDEPTKLSKLKVRCFQAAPVSLQMNIRKYFLTMCHLLSMSSKTSECAVGINAQGRGWHEINEHMIRFGSDRVVAGDFKAYDQHMSAGMVMASYKVFQYIGKKAGFSEEDLKMMQGCATEVAYPVMNLNGDLIKLYGSNPSGQNLTVYTNSIVNSLYHRCVFKILYPKYEGRFTDAVSLMSYGDDVKMSVSKDFPEYNHTKIQSVFNSFGIEYTMAEKEAESVPFIEHEDADFLKRKSRWEPKYSYVNEDGELQQGMWIAMLDKESIFKSLHCNLASKTQAQEEVAIQCICGALREMWFYGREEFNTFHEMMKEVVSRMEWDASMPEQFWLDYDFRELAWMKQNDVEFYTSQSYVSQSAFIRNVQPHFSKNEETLLPIKIHPIASAVMDPYEEELLTSKPPGLQIVAAEYILNRFAGDFLICPPCDVKNPIFICLELKSNFVSVGFKQAMRMQNFTRAWFDVFDGRNPDCSNPLEVYAVAFTPTDFVSDIPEGPLLEIIKEWHCVFANLTRIEYEQRNSQYLPGDLELHEYYLQHKLKMPSRKVKDGTTYRCKFCKTWYPVGERQAAKKCTVRCHKKLMRDTPPADT